MNDITVLRVEVANVDSKSESSLASGKGKSSASTGLAAGAVAGAGVSQPLSKRDKITAELIAYDDAEVAAGRKGLSYGRASTRLGRLNERKQALLQMTDPELTKYEKKLAGRQYARNISAPTYKQASTGIATVATSAAAAYSLYSNYQKAGLEMSGATHAASIQSRKSEAANALVGIGIAAMINPLLAAPMIAMKAWQLAQTNRKELFEIQKSQIQSQVMQRNLVKTVAERRF